MKIEKDNYNKFFLKGSKFRNKCRLPVGFTLHSNEKKKTVESNVPFFVLSVR